MKVKQISVFLENKAGRLWEACKILGDNDINIRALSVAETADFGIVRLIVQNPDKAFEVLKNNGYSVSKTDVIAVEVPDTPGGLGEVLKPLNENGINVEYLYCFVDKDRNAAIDIMRIDDLDKAIDTLKSAGIKIIPEKELYAI
ncbi:MAG: ACT domain-containing protein [Actinomycetia bacterium]|nr:ACT domain-containing protein [Actinomycetes bacterium]